MQQTLAELKGKIESCTIIIGNFKTPVLVMDGTFGWKNNKKVEDLNSIIKQLALTDIYRTLYLKTSEYTFFSNVEEHCLGNMI